MLVGHISFGVFGQDLDTHTSPSINTAIESFRMRVRTIDVSWIMTKAALSPHGPEKIMRSMHFRGSLDLKYLSIPKNGAMFVNLLIEDVHNKWRNIIEDAKSHLERLVSN